MRTLFQQVDAFVRWFFNSSPDMYLIQPVRRLAFNAASAQERMNPTPYFDRTDGVRLRKGAVGGAVLVALLLLAFFYSVVAGAVERGASRRAEVGTQAGVATKSPAARSIRMARLDN